VVLEKKKSNVGRTVALLAAVGQRAPYHGAARGYGLKEPPHEGCAPLRVGGDVEKFPKVERDRQRFHAGGVGLGESVVEHLSEQRRELAQPLPGDLDWHALRVQNLFN